MIQFLKDIGVGMIIIVCMSMLVFGLPYAITTFPFITLPILLVVLAYVFGVLWRRDEL